MWKTTSPALEEITVGLEVIESLLETFNMRPKNHRKIYPNNVGIPFMLLHIRYLLNIVEDTKM